MIAVLVFIAINTIVAALFLPTLGRAEGAARRMACANNTHQINLALLMYAQPMGYDNTRLGK